MYITATIEYQGREITAGVYHQPSEGNGYAHAEFDLDGFGNIWSLVKPSGHMLLTRQISRWLDLVGAGHRARIQELLEREAYELSRRGDY